MIDIEFLERIVRLIDESHLDSIEIERGGTRIRLAKSPAVTVGIPGAAAAPGSAQQVAVSGNAAAPAGSPTAAGETPQGGPASAPSDGLAEITSPMVGTFYRAPAPDAPSYVEVGGRVGVGDTLCIIEAMKLMNELESEISGEVVQICVENAEPVEYGQVLFRVRPN